MRRRRPLSPRALALLQELDSKPDLLLLRSAAAILGWSWWRAPRGVRPEIPDGRTCANLVRGGLIEPHPNRVQLDLYRLSGRGLYVARHPEALWA